MKIKSQFKDYYDYVQHVYGGGDEKVTYDRRRIGEFRDLGTLRYAETVEVVVDVFPKLVSPYGYHDRNRENFNWLVVCGKPYPLVNDGPRDTWGSIYPIKWEVADPDKHGHLIGHRSPRHYGIFDDGSFTEVGKEDEKLIILSRAIGHPVFMISRWHSEKPGFRVYIDGNCPVLDSMGLAAVYPAEQLYQDLAYFIGNLIHPSPDVQPPTKSTDKEKIQQHGFDVKKSFRHRKD